MAVRGYTWPSRKCVYHVYEKLTRRKAETQFFHREQITQRRSIRYWFYHTGRLGINVVLLKHMSTFDYIHLSFFLKSFQTLRQSRESNNDGQQAIC